jgi:small subunit ribosomal protein S21
MLLTSLAHRPANLARLFQVPPSGHRSNARTCTKSGKTLQVLVRDNNVEQALRVLKKKMQREGLFREMKARRSYEKPSEKRAREKAEAVRRARKLARKQAQREGLIPAPKKKPAVGRPGPRA